MTAVRRIDDAAGRAEAIAVLRAGGIVALPTDTVYGIGVDLHTAHGVERLFHVKHRPPEKGIVLLLEEPSQAQTLAIWPAAAEALAAVGWPGGLTLVLRQRPDVSLPAALTGGADTIGVRVPDHACPRALAAALGPLPVTSANVSGVPEAKDADEVASQLGDRVDLILDGGPARGGVASTVVDVSIDRPRVLRAGAIPPARIAEILAAAGIGHDVVD